MAMRINLPRWFCPTGRICASTGATEPWQQPRQTKPIDIANAVVEKLTAEREQPAFGEAVAVMPGFINLKLSEAFLADYMKGMAEADKLGLEEPEKKETIIVDYGGANVASPFMWAICVLLLSERASSAWAALCGI